MKPSSNPTKLAALSTLFESARKHLKRLALVGIALHVALAGATVHYSIENAERWERHDEDTPDYYENLLASAFQPREHQLGTIRAEESYEMARTETAEDSRSFFLLSLPATLVALLIAFVARKSSLKKASWAILAACGLFIPWSLIYHVLAGQGANVEEVAPAWYSFCLVMIVYSIFVVRNAGQRAVPQPLSA